MSIISKIYFSSKSIKSIEDLENDSDALIADISSKGFGCPALLDEELSAILPNRLEVYKINTLTDSEESELVSLSPEFVSHCINLESKNLSGINTQINDYLSNRQKNIQKRGIGNIPGRIKILLGVLLGSSLSFYKNDLPTVGIVLIVISIGILTISLKVVKGKNKKVKKSNNIDYRLQLRELISTCKKAKDSGLSIYYYWSL